MKQFAGSQPHIMIVGVVRNASKTLARDIHLLRKSTAFFQEVSWHLVESDSSDNTVAQLTEFKNKIIGFEFETMGDLRTEIPSRVARISYCRNLYLQALERKIEQGKKTWVLVVDLDGLNTKNVAKPLFQAIASDLADAYFANQQGPYYDIYALRHGVWNPRDCWNEYSELVHQGASAELALRMAVTSKMIRIPKHEALIHVTSAFGGMAAYRADLLVGRRYSAKTREGREVCEHVPLNESISADGYRLSIVPSLINARFTEHTRHLKPFRLAVSPFRRVFKKIAVNMLGDTKALAIYEWILNARRK